MDAKDTKDTRTQIIELMSTYKNTHFQSKLDELKYKLTAEDSVGKVLLDSMQIVQKEMDELNLKLASLKEDYIKLSMSFNKHSDNLFDNVLKEI